ncbi:NAD-dependent epimerase/dehydratase family protein [Parasporobacterium paucivorans]|uniref:Dihydroflavonol-4-reductase n=1 Tax=Parasporobacterium paucivorans DSM 15970 TaxID=1122934 RepID=A0A1M6HJN6_9FIRM|nr:NAD-dependent epimerase/dehydratase family protein [Parasporobacterium paucivorans]SHJ22385.1 dihydroflavonol-4-reductase [Parasporobacterium paucivorans DSM 15970]
MGIKYLITGAAGHLGYTLVRILSEKGAEVRALVLPCDRETLCFPDNVEIFAGDVRDVDSLEGFFIVGPKTDSVLIHCAGIVSIASGYLKDVIDVNVHGTRNIVRLCMKHRVSKLVYVSSVHAIPELPGREEITEVKDFEPGNVKGLYAKTKAAATKYVLEAAKRGLNASVVHPSGICGPYDNGAGHLTQLVLDFYKGRLVAGTTGGYDFVDVRDVAAGILSCCLNGKAGECYILSNRYYKVTEILDMLSDISGKKKIRIVIPMQIARATAPLAELYYRFRKSTPLYTAYSLYTITSNSNFSHEKADRELGYKVRPFQETLADTANWLQKNNRC